MLILTVFLPEGLPFPISIPEGCFLSFIGSGIQTDSLSPFLTRKDSYTFTISFQHTNFSTEDIDLIGDIENVTLREYYFRYTVKLRNSCNAVMLHTLTFNETISAIYNSGYGTSDQTLFFLHFENPAEWSDHIEKFSALYNYSSFVFHANMIFIGPNKNSLGVHCYFCQPNPTRLHLINISEFQSFLQLKLFAQQLNANGHGRHGVVNSAVGELTVSDCFRIDQKSAQRSRNKFYEYLQEHCAPPDVVIYVVTQQALNATWVTQEKDVPEEELDDFEWFIRMKYGEGLLSSIPNDIINTRSYVITMQSLKYSFISCITTRSISENLDYVILSVIHGSTWAALLSVSFTFAFIYKSLLRGVDTLWPLVSQTCWHNHPRKLICVYYICMIFLSNVYGSNISSESVQLQEFPSISKLIKNGYKVWFPQKRYLSTMPSESQKQIAVALVTSAIGKGLLGGGSYQDKFKSAIDLFYDGSNSTGLHVPSYQNFPELIENLTTLKLLLSTPTIVRTLGTVASRDGLIDVNNEQLCKLFVLNDLKLESKLRLFSYLSYRAYILHQRFKEIGIPTRFEKLQIDMNFKQMRQLKLKTAGVCVPPNPIPLRSAVGVSIIALYVIGTILFMVNFHEFLIVGLRCGLKLVKTMVTKFQSSFGDRD
ncbi:unnamed protein product [Orchesella dallaii]|uniref:Uncharacterized protein n=1 Tax=Orchesella dallaii TaxID=48710 RepID=A0ABP1QGY9_9HEXA